MPVEICESVISSKSYGNVASYTDGVWASYKIFLSRKSLKIVCLGG